MDDAVELRADAGEFAAAAQSRATAADTGYAHRTVRVDDRAVETY